MRVKDYKELRVYRLAYESAMEVLRLSRGWPSEEKFSLTSQARRSARSVAANIAEAWRKRRYEAAFVSKLSDAESEAAETQVWIEFAVKCGYLGRSPATKLCRDDEGLIRSLVGMAQNSERWVFVADSPKRA